MRYFSLCASLVHLTPDRVHLTPVFVCSPHRYLTLLDGYFFAAYAVLLLSVVALLISPDAARHARTVLATGTYLAWIGLHLVVFVLQTCCFSLSLSWESLAEQNAAGAGLRPTVNPGRRPSRPGRTSVGQSNLI